MTDKVYVFFSYSALPWVERNIATVFEGIYRTVLILSQWNPCPVFSTIDFRIF